MKDAVFLSLFCLGFCITPYADEIRPDKSAIDSVTDRLLAFNAKLEDKATSLRIKSRLISHPTIHGFGIHVKTVEGGVTLTGSVQSEDEKDQIMRIARATEGVISVNDNINIGIKRLTIN